MSASTHRVRCLAAILDTGKLTWAIVFAAVLVLLAIIANVQQTAVSAREQAFISAQDNNTKIALSDEVRIRSLFASLDKVLLVLRRDFKENPRLSHQDILFRLDELKIEGELNPRLTIFDASGEVVVSSAVSTSGEKLKFNVADREFFQKKRLEQTDQLDVASPLLSRITGQWVMPLTRRISNKDGSFAGVINMAVEPRLFTEPIGHSSKDANATRALIGLDGFVRVRMKGHEISFGGDARKSRLFEELKSSPSGSFTAIASMDGVNRLASYRLISPYQIIILAASSVDSIEASYRDKVRTHAIESTLLGLLVVLLSGLLIHGISRQKKLFESQQSFNRLIELVPQLVTSLDLKGNIIWVNSRTVEFVGPSHEQQAKGFDWVVAAIHPDDKSRVKEYLSSALERHQNAESCEYRKRRFDGDYLWFSSQITYVLDKDGAIASFLQTGTDIHDRKMAEERSRISSKLESIGQLTGGMAHDFNNLLAIILGNLDLLRPDVTADAASRRLEVAINANQRGVGLVKSLLALASKQPLLPAKIELWALVERIAPLLRHALGQRVELSMHPPAAPVYVEVDEAGLEAVLLNLIVNARDAMPKGGTLTLGLEVSDGMACLFVKDTGTGMPEAVLKRATEPFFTTKERGHGTGLGLSMVAGFAKQSGGKMKIQSEEGKGTTIEIHLPLMKAKSKPEVPVAVRPPQANSVGKRGILIVDDEPALRELAQEWAKAEGHDVLVANSADEALTLLQAKAFDILVTDIIMPGEIDGLGLAEEASERYPAMNILLMSGYSKDTATNRADVQWPLLVKPFSRLEFYAALKELETTDFGQLA